MEENKKDYFGQWCLSPLLTSHSYPIIPCFVFFKIVRYILIQDYHSPLNGDAIFCQKDPTQDMMNEQCNDHTIHKQNLTSDWITTQHCIHTCALKSFLFCWQIQVNLYKVGMKFNKCYKMIEFYLMFFLQWTKT